VIGYPSYRRRIVTTNHALDREVRQIELEAVAATVLVAGQPVELLTYNGVFPGPLLRFSEGDRVRIRLANRLAEPTNLHFHGLHIPTEVDDPGRVVEPGATTDYEFDVAPGTAGTYWYHPHVHGSVSRQLFAGLAGPLLVDGPPDLDFEQADEQVLVVKDLTIDGVGVAAHTSDDWLNGKEGELVLVNGQLEPVIALSTGLARLRVINACTARYLQLRLDGSSLVVLGAGVGFAEQPHSAETLLVAPGERTDVLARLDPRTPIDLLALPYDRGADMSGMDDMTSSHGGHGGHGGHHNGGRRLGNSQPVRLATFEAASSAGPIALPDRLGSVPTVGPGELRYSRRLITLSEEMGSGRVRFLLNGQEFSPERIDFRVQLKSTEIWEVENQADMDHPFHLHVFPFVVLSRNGVPEPHRMWRDTVNLQQGDRIELLVPFEHFSGTTVYHCHIVEHEDRGMMGRFAIDP
jgi:FtsP/CotA-like multicopper oxidase with cupredoxin domain